MTRLLNTVSWLMFILAIFAVDFGVLGLLRGTRNPAMRGLLPMADVLAVLLATIVVRLRRCGEVPFSRLMFLFGGGMALILFVYVAQLRPDVVYGLLPNTVGRRGGGSPLENVLIAWLALSVPILVPALFAGWAARGYRLRLTT